MTEKILSAMSLVGKRHNISKTDNYATPNHMVESLFKREKFDGVVYEPACGDGEMVKIIKKYNICIASDIRTDVNNTPNIDFLKTYRPMENIITNPPYNLATEFLTHALNLYKKKLALLLRLNFLESCKRYKIFKTSNLKTVYVFSKRQTLKPYGTGKTGNGTIVYAWYVWDKSFLGKPQLDWINDNYDSCTTRKQTSKESS